VIQTLEFNTDIPQSLLENLIVAELREPETGGRVRRECRRRHETHELALEHRDAAERCFAYNRIEKLFERGLTVVREVRRHLDDVAVVERGARRFPGREPAATLANRRCDYLSRLEAIGRQVDVVRDERPASTDG